MKIKPEDVMFWILIALIVFVALWKLVGSPTDTATLISVILFFACSEILIWKHMFSIEKKTAIGFMKIKNDIEKQDIKINYRLDKINSNLTNQNLKFNKIESILINKQKK